MDEAGSLFSLLTVEWDCKNEVLEIHGNKQGLEALRNTLDLLLKKSGNDHSHLMSSSWGGNELSEVKQCDQNELINHIKIFKWEDVET